MPTGKNWVSKSFSISLEDLAILEELEEIARRENPVEPSKSEHIVKAIKEYVQRHGSDDPNYQQTLGDYNGKSPKTTAFIKAEIMRNFEGKSEVNYRDVLKKVKTTTIPVSRHSEITNAIVRELHQKGVRIWR